MKILIVEDDFVSRKVLKKYLSYYGDCDIAVDGKEAIVAFNSAHKDNKPYDLICLDIMMPEMDGQETLKETRRIEEEKGIRGLSRVKVIMTTVLDDRESIMEAFRSQCDGYILKPIDRQKLMDLIDSLELPQVESCRSNS